MPGLCFYKYYREKHRKTLDIFLLFRMLPAIHIVLME